MNHAVLQKTLDLPDEARLNRAFAAVPGFTTADAARMARNAFGILVKGEPLTGALALLRALAVEGIDTIVVPENELPALPITRNVKQVECTPEGLVVHDVLGRPTTVEWDGITLVAAGRIRMLDYQRPQADESRVDEDEYGVGMLDVAMVLGGLVDVPVMGRSGPSSVTRPQSSEDRRERLILEIVVGHGVARYTVEADPANLVLFQCLGERRTKKLLENFALLVQDIARHVPHAAMNRGACQLCNPAVQPLIYPAKNAFYDEIIWILWQMTQPREEGPETM